MYAVTRFLQKFDAPSKFILIRRRRSDFKIFCEHTYNTLVRKTAANGVIAL